MTHMMKSRAALAVAALVPALVAGCSSGGETNPAGRILTSIIPAAASIPGLEPPPPPPVPGFEAADIAAAPDAYVILHAEVLGDPVLARLISDGGGVQTFLSQANQTASYRDGILVSTRGMGEDLIAASVTGVRAALAAGGGSAVRIHDRIDDQDGILRQTFACEIVADGVQTVDLGTRQVAATFFRENCVSDALSFENNYWVGAGGEIVSSLQFVTLGITYLRRNEI